MMLEVIRYGGVCTGNIFTVSSEVQYPPDIGKTDKLNPYVKRKPLWEDGYGLELGGNGATRV